MLSFWEFLDSQGFWYFGTNPDIITGLWKQDDTNLRCLEWLVKKIGSIWDLQNNDFKYILKRWLNDLNLIFFVMHMHPAWNQELILSKIFNAVCCTIYLCLLNFFPYMHTWYGQNSYPHDYKNGMQFSRMVCHGQKVYNDSECKVQHMDENVW